jgi:hypothetical protein
LAELHVGRTPVIPGEPCEDKEDEKEEMKEREKEKDGRD